MKYKGFSCPVAILILLLSPLLSLSQPPLSPPASKTPTVIRVGITNYSKVEEAYKRYESLFKELEDASPDKSVTFRFAMGTYGEVIDWYNNNQIDVAFLSALPAAELLLNASQDELRQIQNAYIGNIGQKDELSSKQKEKGMRLVSDLYREISTADKDGFSFKYRVVGFVRSSDYKEGLRNLSDLRAMQTAQNLRALPVIQGLKGVPKDKLKFLFVKPDSMSGFVIPLKYLNDNGIRPDESQIEFTGSHQNSIDRLQDKEKDRDKVLVAFVNNSVAYDPKSDFSINKLEGTEGLDNLFAPHLSVLVNHRLQLVDKELFQRYRDLLYKLFKDRIEDKSDGYEFDFHRIPVRDEQPDVAQHSSAEANTKDAPKRAAWTEQYDDVRRVLQEALYPQRVLYRSTFDELIADLQNRRKRGEPTRLALVLSGGGAKCAYQAGAIQEVENRIQQVNTYISIGDFKKNARLFEQLRLGLTPASKFIQEKLSGQTIYLLDEYHNQAHALSKLKSRRKEARDTSGTEDKSMSREVREREEKLDKTLQRLQRGVADDLNNNLIEGDSLFDLPVFTEAAASEEAQQLSAPLRDSLLLGLLKRAVGEEAQKLVNQMEPAAQKRQRINRLNRLILEKTFPDAIGRLDIELVVGTSGGAINALLVALGLTRDANSQGKISEAWQSFEQGQIFSPSRGLVLFLILSLGLLKCLIIIIGILSFGHRTMTRKIGRNSLLALMVFLGAELFTLNYFDISKLATWVLLIEGVVLGALFITVRTIPFVNRHFYRVLLYVTRPVRSALLQLIRLFRKGEPKAAAPEDKAKEEEGNWWLSAAELVLSMSLLLLVMELIITKTYIGESLVYSSQMDWLQHLYVMLSFGLLLSTILPFVLGLSMWGFALFIRHWRPLIVNHHELAFHSFSSFVRRRRFRPQTEEMEKAMPLIKRSSIWDRRGRQLIAQVIIATLVFAAMLLGMQLFLKEHFPSGEGGIEQAFVKAMRMLDSDLDKSVSADGGSKEELRRLSQKLSNDKLVRDLVITASRLPSSDEDGKNSSGSQEQTVIRVQSDGVGAPDGPSPSPLTSLVYSLLSRNRYSLPRINKLRTLTPNELPEDLYFYYRYNRNTNLDIPSDSRFIDLKYPLNADKLLDVVIGSSSIYPIFPYRVLNNIDVGHEANPKPVREVKIVDGGFIHNIPIEAAVKWKATHILIIEASPESRPFAPQNFMENSEVAFNYLFSQAQRMDDIPRGSVEIYRLRPMSQCEKLNYKPDCANQPPQPNIDTLDFSKIKTGEAFKIGVDDLKGDNPLITRVPGPPLFRTVLRVAPARFETVSRQPSPE